MKEIDEERSVRPILFLFSVSLCRLCCAVEDRWMEGEYCIGIGEDGCVVCVYDSIYTLKKLLECGN